MNFLAPIYFLFSLFLVGVLLFYLFRKQYESKVIPSTLLWQQVMQEWQATKWWKKLQNHLLLYLQLLILLCLMLALTRPYFGMNEFSGEHIVVVVDTSASMTTVEADNTSRFALAKTEIIELIDKLDDQALTVILGEEVPTILFANETDVKTMQRAIDDIEPSYQYADMGKAIQLANQIISGTSGEIHVFSDAVVKEEVDQNNLQHKLVVHNIGTTQQNLSLHTFGVAPDDEGVSGIVTVYNEFQDEQLVRIRIEHEGEELYTLQELIEPDKLVQIAIPNLPARSYYKAVMMTEDNYEADNELVAFLSEDISPSIHLIGEVNSFTTKALSYFSEDIIQYEENATILEDSGVYIVEGIPEENWPQGPKIIFSPVVGGDFDVQEKQTLVSERTIQEDSLLQYVDMDQVYIQASAPYRYPELNTLVTSGDIPLISKGYYQGYPIVFVGFDIADTDWPLHASFPIFLYNAINYLNETEETYGYVKPFERFTISHQSGATSGSLVDEQGETIEKLNLDESFVQAPSIPGLYRIVEEMNGAVTEKLFAVAIDPQEKFIHPSDSFSIEVNEEGINKSQEKPNEIWPWLVLFAFVVLLAEWEVYRRGLSN